MRPETIEDILITLHTGQWFGFNGDKVYANLWVADGYDKPTEEELNTLLATKQAEYDGKDWERNRQNQYPSFVLRHHRRHAFFVVQGIVQADQSDH